jgi:cobalt/nickel transport system permease protein
MGVHHGDKRCDTISKADFWAYRWEPRTKTVAAIFLIMGIVSLGSLQLVFTGFLVVLLLSLSTGFTLRLLLSRMMWAAPFLLLMALPIILGGGFPPDPQRLYFAGLIAFKALTSIVVMTVLLRTQPVHSYFNGLAHMKFPPVLLSVLFLSYRYVFLFRDQLANTQRALAARLFRPGLKKRSLAVYGETAGGLLLKAVDRSDAVYRAMVARGFDGRLRTGAPLPITKGDYFKCGVTMLLTVVLILLDWRWLL